MKKEHRVPIYAEIMAFLAVAMSYAINKSIMWCIIHGLLGSFYVMYWLFTYTEFQSWILKWVTK